MAAKLVIGLTGNIATGKSLVLRMLQELGATGIDADQLTHQLMGHDSLVFEEIVREFGQFVVDTNGQIHRGRLGRIVFNDPEALSRLENIIHPVVYEEVLKLIDEADTSIVAVEAIKLFEAGLADQCQSIWVITAPPEVQLRRLVERRKMDPAQAQQRIRAQSPAEEKVAKADVVIENSGDLGKTWAFVKKQYTTFTQAQADAAHAGPAAETTPITGAAVRAVAIDPADITVRRAKREDLRAMTELIATATGGGVKPDLNLMMESLFSRAYLVALANGYVIGIAGWQTENLIAGLQDFYVLRDDLWATVGEKMLAKIHDEISSLSCEVAMAFVLSQAGHKPVEFFESQGYEQSESKSLGYIWKDAAMEWQPENSILLYKKLREHRIMVPM